MEDKLVLLKDHDYLTFWKDNLTKDNFYRESKIVTVENTTSPAALVPSSCQEKKLTKPN